MHGCILQEQRNSHQAREYPQTYNYIPTDHRALRSCVYENRHHHASIHIFTDSQYTYNAVTSQKLRKKHFYLFEEIHNYAHQIRGHNEAWQPVIHYLPSHIEMTAAGLRFTGTYFADKLANDGRMKSRDEDSDKFIHIIRKRILSATVRFIDSIEEKLQNSENSYGPFAQANDVSATNSVDTDRDPSKKGIS